MGMFILHVGKLPDATEGGLSMAPKNLLALRAECVKRYNQAGDTTPREIASWIAAKTAIEIIDAILADREEVA